MPQRNQDLKRDSAKIPDQFRALFWDVTLDKADTRQHADYVIERFLDFGTLEGIRWLRNVYSDERIAKFIRERSYRLRSAKTVNFWHLMLNIPASEWTSPSSRRIKETS